MYFLGATEEELKVLESLSFIENLGNGNYQIHDYEQYQPLKSSVEELSAKRAKAGRKGMSKRWGHSQNKKQDNITSNNETENQENILPTDSITSVITKNNNGITKTLDKDIDIDIDIYKKENIIKEKNQLQIENNNAAYERSQSTLTAHPKHQPEEYDQLTSRLKAIYPAERFDLQTTRNQTLLEAYWFKVEDHAATYGKNPFDWLVEQTQAYLKVTERRYVQRFSKYFMTETYAQDWKNAMPQLSRSQENLNRNLDFINSISDKPLETHNFVREITA